MPTRIETMKDFYSQCVEDLVDYQEHFITQRKQYTSTQLTLFLYVILGAVIIHSNNHIYFPIEHGLISSCLMFFGFACYVALFNVNFLVQRKWQLGVGCTINDIQKVLGESYRHSYSIDSGLMETSLLATLFGLVCFSISGLLIPYSYGALIGISSAVISFKITKRYIQKNGNAKKTDEPNYLDRDSDMAELEKAWKTQKSLITRMCFVNQSLNLIRKTLLISFVIYPAVIIGDIFTKDIDISAKMIGMYALLSAFIFEIVILTIWNYDILETQSDAKVIFENGLELEKVTPAMPSLWHNIGASAPENSIIFHMNNLYFFPLILSQAIGVVFIWSSQYNPYLKALISTVSGGIALLIAGVIIRKSLAKKR